MPDTRSQRPALWLTMLVALLSLSACGRDWRNAWVNPDTSTFTAQYWSTPQRGTEYPEMADPNIRNRASFGVAFQGGGNRAAPATLGQLRALHELGWIDKVRYITAVSGGSWTAIPYTYLKNGATARKSAKTESLFLGKSYTPQEIAQYVPLLMRDYSGDIAKELMPPASMLGAISDARVARRMIRAWLGGRFDEAFSAVLEDIYLNPFDLGRTNKSEPDSLFTWRPQDARRMRQSGKALNEVQVHTVERTRPYLIVGGTLLTKRTNIDVNLRYRTEMTPLYSGVPYALPLKKPRRVGGGFVESYGYDYVTKKVNPGAGKTELVLTNPQYGNRTDSARLNFSLANMAAISGAAPVETIVTKTPTAVLLANFGFPEHYVPIDQENNSFSEAFARKGELFQKEWAHGDGGHEDNLGLAPLLARQVKNIIVFANAYAPIDPDKIANCRTQVGELVETPKHDALPSCGSEMMGNDIPSFFFENTYYVHNDSLKLRKNDGRYGNHKLRGYYDAITVAEDLKDNENISCERYDYTPSSFMVGVPYSPTICFVFLGLDKTWIENVMGAAKAGDEEDIMNALEVDRKGNKAGPIGIGSEGFPHLGTFLDKGIWLIDTAPARLFALANLTSWTLHKRQDIIRNSFRKNGLNLP